VPYVLVLDSFESFHEGHIYDGSLAEQR
jgi:hypothetical protein